LCKPPLEKDWFMKSVARLLLHRTNIEVWHRGVDYVNQGRVKILRFDENEVEALVTGHENYRVFIKPLKKGIRKECSCPYQGDVCKHLVATAIIETALL